ncbi:MAG: hypothetical protein KKD38_09845, partial [Candidatus Delongbacteria bacterium]|nr:hypothetical protein [Candidatus Delongbacteria bacterium]MCG2760543.1 hypothetical protein [Candidatus Delongbacteria bacterium]
VTLAVVFLSFGQEIEVTQSNPFKNSLGIRFSNITGYGLSFSRQIFDNYTFKAGGIVFYDEYIKGNNDSIIQDTKNIIYDYGFELQRNFFKSGNTRVYMLGGIYFANEQNKDEWNGVASTDQYEDIIAGGVGIGVEFTFKSRFGLNIDFGYKFENSEGEEEGIPVTKNNTQLGLGIGLSYLY